MNVVTNRMLDAALRYAARGWPVIPLHTPTDYDRCSCNNTDCASVGKHPRTMHGLSDASTDPEVVRKWWTQWPKANIGVITNDLVVIDIDPRHGGDESYRDLIAKHGPGLTQTLTAVTGGGGQHLVFACPAGVHIGNVANRPGYAGPLGPGVDVRAYGGYIVAPPSLHQSGARYQWEEEGEQPARLPLPLYELLTARPEKQVDHELVSAADILSGVDAGGRDWALFRLAAKLRYADVPYDWARTLVLEAAANARPPFPANEALKKLDSAYKRYEAGKGAFVAPGDDKPPEEALIDWPAFWTTDQKAAEWLCEPLIPLGRQVSIYSRAKSGKSLLVLDICARLATGQKCLYQPAGEPMRVVYFDFEMTDLDLRERLEDMGYGPDSDLSNLFYYLLPSLPPMDTQAGGEAVMEIVRRHDPTLVVIDTTSRVISGKENDSDSFRAFYMYTGLQLKADGRTVVRLDHMGKAQELGQRGSSAKNDDVDLVWELTVQDGGAVKLTATHRRQGWVPEEVNLVRKDEPLRHALAANTWPAGTEALARTLDEIGAPLSGVRQVRDLLKANGRKAENKVLAAAMRYRRERPQSVTENAAEHVAGIADTDSAEHSVTDSVTPPVTLRNSVTGSEEALRSLKKSVTLPNPAPERRKNADGLYVDEEGKPLL